MLYRHKIVQNFTDIHFYVKTDGRFPLLPSAMTTFPSVLMDNWMFVRFYMVLCVCCKILLALYANIAHDIYMYSIIMRRACLKCWVWFGLFCICRIS